MGATLATLAACGGPAPSTRDAAGDRDGADASLATFLCAPSQPDGGWTRDGPPPPSTNCILGREYCEDARCFDLGGGVCYAYPRCPCVTHDYVNCHCTETMDGIVTNLGCDPI